MIIAYPASVEAQMQRYYQSLSEKDRRRYAAIEAMKLGYGGQAHLWRLLGCHHATLALGLAELNDIAALDQERVRQPGGGRKSALATMAGLDEAFLRVLERHTAGSPMDETLKWTNLKRHEIAALLQDEGITVSVTVVDPLLKKHHFRKRKAVKALATGTSEHRHEPFETIERLKETYQVAGNPVMSMDTKKENGLARCTGRAPSTRRNPLRCLTTTGPVWLLESPFPMGCMT
ncbi:transposase [Leptolyngbya sp. BL0902]|nr:transposase [Leptolyngbya sp. BL0902]